jgi:DNA-binding PadR family transcriptional regulator
MKRQRRSTGLRLILLSLIFRRGTSTGYQLGRVLNKEFRQVWPATLQQIYAELSKLHDERLVEFEIRDGKSNGPSRKEYSITSVGKAKLEDWLRNTSCQVHRDGIFAQLLCSDLVGIPSLRSQIQGRLDQRLTEMAAISALLSPDGRPLGERLALELELSRVRAEANWCTAALGLLIGGYVEPDRREPELLMKRSSDS